MDPTAAIEPPLQVTDAEAAAWDDEAEVVVVGFGCAGAAAALEAHERGAKVLLVDRFEGGGATAYSGGIYYAGNTPYQREAGYEDSAENMYAYLSQEVGDAVRPQTLRRFCEDSAPNIEWLAGHGVPFSGAVFKGKSTYPPQDKFLYYSGNEKLARFAGTSKPMPRGHRVYGKGWTGGVFFECLERAVGKAGIRTLSHARATRLVVDGGGRVVGVEVCGLPSSSAAPHQALYRKVDPFKPFGFEKANRAIAECNAMEASQGKPLLLRARKGVILATGGFAYNLEMLQQHLPRYAQSADCLLRLGSAACDGGGLRLGQSVGAELGKMNRLFAGRAITPPFDLLEGIVVNREGRRFVNEDAYNATLGEAIADQQDSAAWLVLPGATFWSAFWKLMPRGDGNFMNWYLPTLLNVLFGGTKRAKTIRELAVKCGMDANGLEATVAKWNDDAWSGRPDPLDKLAEYVRPVNASTYYAINMGMRNKFSFMLFFTLGGIRIDEETGAAVRGDGSPIAGLYAAGRAAVGVCANTYACSGISLADGVFSGRRAGRSCADDASSRGDVIPAKAGIQGVRLVE